MFKVSKKTFKQHANNKVDNKNTKTTPGASMFNFEHTLHFIPLLTLLNSNKQMPVGLEKL